MREDFEIEEEIEENGGNDYNEALIDDSVTALKSSKEGIVYCFTESQRDAIMEKVPDIAKGTPNFHLCTYQAKETLSTKSYMIVQKRTKVVYDKASISTILLKVSKQELENIISGKDRTIYKPFLLSNKVKKVILFDEKGENALAEADVKLRVLGSHKYMALKARKLFKLDVDRMNKATKNSAKCVCLLLDNPIVYNKPKPITDYMIDIPIRNYAFLPLRKKERKEKCTK